MSIDTDLDFVRLDQILESGTRAELDEFCAQNDLEIVDGEIRYRHNVTDKVKFWDKRQLVRKILLNS